MTQQASSASAAAIKQEVQKQVMTFLEKGMFEDNPQVRMLRTQEAPAGRRFFWDCRSDPSPVPQVAAVRRRYLLDSGASHRVEWLPEGEDANDYERIMLQLAVGEVPGLMKAGAGTVYLDTALMGTPGLEDMQELLPLGRLCQDYGL